MTVYDLSFDFSKRYMINRLRPTTISGYSVNINNHILPYLADVDIELLTVGDIDDLTAQLGSKGLTNKTILYVHATFRKMLNYAKKRGYVSSNVYDQADLPRVDTYSHKVLNKAQLSRLIGAVSGSVLELPVILAACYGLRRGEVLGLKADDYDATEGVLHVQRTKSTVSGSQFVTPCKTENGDRYILIAESHRRLFEGNTGNEVLVPLTQYQLNNRFSRLALRLGYQGLRFHDLRHSYATLMMKEGVNPKIVSSVLGHCDVSVTLEIYSHPDIESQHACLNTLENSLGLTRTE